MRCVVPLAVSLFLAGGSLTAQAFESSFTLWPGVTQLASRGGLGNVAGELLGAFPTNVVRGIGTSGCACRILGVRTAIQNANAITPTPFSLVFRSGTDPAGPGTSNASLLASVAATFPAAGPGPASFLFTATLATPLTVSCSRFLAAGVGVPAVGPTGAGDLSLHIALAQSGARAHPNADDVAWEVPAGAAAARHPAPPQVFRVELLLDTPTLEVGNGIGAMVQPFFGLGGAFPDTTQVGVWSQGLALRCRAPGGAQASVAVIAAWGFDAAPFTVPGVLSDCIFVDRSTLIPSVIATGLADGAPIPIAPPGVGALPSLNGAGIVWQAVLLGGTLTATNAVATVLR